MHAHTLTYAHTRTHTHIHTHTCAHTLTHTNTHIHTHTHTQAVRLFAQKRHGLACQCVWTWKSALFLDSRRDSWHNFFHAGTLWYLRQQEGSSSNWRAFGKYVCTDTVSKHLFTPRTIPFPKHLFIPRTSLHPGENFLLVNTSLVSVSRVHRSALGPFRKYCACDMFKRRIRTTWLLRIGILVWLRVHASTQLAAGTHLASCSVQVHCSHQCTSSGVSVVTMQNVPHEQLACTRISNDPSDPNPRSYNKLLFHKKSPLFFGAFSRYLSQFDVRRHARSLVQPIADGVVQHLENVSTTFPTNQNSANGIYD